MSLIPSPPRPFQPSSLPSTQSVQSTSSLVRHAVTASGHAQFLDRVPSNASAIIPTLTTSSTASAATPCAASSFRNIPRDFATKHRLVRQLTAFLLSATDPLSGTPSSSALAPMVHEACQALEAVQRKASAESRGTAATPPTGDPSVTSTSSSLVSLKRSRLHATAAPTDASGAAQSHSDLADAVLSESTRYIVAACRAANPAQSVSLLERANSEGSLLASVELGYCYTFGVGCPQSTGMGLELLDSAVSMGHPGAMYAVAKCLRDGVGVPKDPTTALVWLRRSAEANHIFAQHELAEVFEDGWPEAGVEKSLPLALRWYKRAATLGFDESQLNLGKMLLMSSQVQHLTTSPTVDAPSSTDGVPSYGELFLKAKRWVEMAAQSGNVEAMQLLERLQKQQA